MLNQKEGFTTFYHRTTKLEKLKEFWHFTSKNLKKKN